MELETLIERTQKIREAMPVTDVKQRLAEAAAELSRAGDNQARVELLNESVLALTTILYACDPDGTPANIDSKTYRLLVPAPWGRAGWRKWGLRYWEADMLRRILIIRGQMTKIQPLFDYNGESRQWYLNYHAYPRLDLALLYWKQNPITLKEWRTHADIYRRQAHERMSRQRSEE